MTTLRESVGSVFELLIATYDNWRSDRAIRLGASLAYYAVFAAVPLLTSAIAIAGLVFSEADIQAFIIESLEGWVSDVSPDVRNLVDTLAAAVDRPSTTGGMATFSVLFGIFAASLLFVAMQDSFNTIWEIPVQRGFQHSLQRKFVAFGVVLLTGAVLMASLVVQTIALLVDEILGGNIEALDAFDDLIVGLITWGLGVAALGVLFQLLIREHLTWRYVSIAAAVTGALMVVGTWAAGVYFSNWGSTSLTGVFSGVLIVLTWLYFMAQILIAGAELLKTLEDRLRAAAAG